MNEIKIEMFAFYENGIIFDIGREFMKKVIKEDDNFILMSKF